MRVQERQFLKNFSWTGPRGLIHRDGTRGEWCCVWLAKFDNYGNPVQRLLARANLSPGLTWRIKNCGYKLWKEIMYPSTNWSLRRRSISWQRREDVSSGIELAKTWQAKVTERPVVEVTRSLYFKIEYNGGNDRDRLPLQPLL